MDNFKNLFSRAYVTFRVTAFSPIVPPHATAMISGLAQEWVVETSNVRWPQGTVSDPVCTNRWWNKPSYLLATTKKTPSWKVRIESVEYTSVKVTQSYLHLEAKNRCKFLNVETCWDNICACQWTRVNPLGAVAQLSSHCQDMMWMPENAMHRKTKCCVLCTITYIICHIIHGLFDILASTSSWEAKSWF